MPPLAAPDTYVFGNTAHSRNRHHTSHYTANFYDTLSFPMPLPLARSHGRRIDHAVWPVERALPIQIVREHSQPHWGNSHHVRGDIPFVPDGSS